MLLVFFTICTVDPVSCTQLPMQLIICAGRSAPRITMSRSLSTLAGASFATVVSQTIVSSQLRPIAKSWFTR